MKAWYCFPILGIFIFSLTGCTQTRSISEIASQVDLSVVLINYKDQGGHGTGFFVPGIKANCTVLTARHVVSASEELKLKTNDNKVWEVSNIQRFPNHDLALLTFTPDDKRCPYQILELGDSNTVKRAQRLYISGFFNSGGRLVNHFVSGDVTAIDSLPDGYGIAYQAVTTKGMSGSPVINVFGEVVAVHGRSDVEVTRLAEIKNFPKPELQSDETIERGARIGTFKWGIPINLYLDNIPEEKPEAIPTLSAEDFYNQGNDLLASEKYQEAIISYDKAIEINPDDYQAWTNRGVALGNLGRYQEEIASYDKAIEINPDDAYAWFGRGVALDDLGKYEAAITSYNKAIEINPDDYEAWNNRGISLEKLGRYEAALDSYNKAIDINPNDTKAINNRKNILKKLNQ
ncbi:MAG: tetratricopeptide repeat-containing serine protease family protein [Xenococcus sp. MO_188.B8]|nr:tetratricopeptide repeat-containing serine protease family protein [Xenococcus sp. MO_188.B8]